MNTSELQLKRLMDTVVKMLSVIDADGITLRLTGEEKKSFHYKKVPVYTIDNPKNENSIKTKNLFVPFIMYLHLFIISINNQSKDFIGKTGKFIPLISRTSRYLLLIIPMSQPKMLFLLHQYQLS